MKKNLLLKTFLIPTVIFMAACNRTGLTTPVPGTPVTNPGNPATPVLPDPNPGGPNNPVNSLSMEQVYAPILHFDSQEKHPMTSVEGLLLLGSKLEGHKAFGKNPLIKQPLSINDLISHTNPLVEVNGKKYPLMIQTDDQVSQFDGKVYTHTIQIEDYTYIQYWFFYAFNDTRGIGGNSVIWRCGNHQGDWEHVAVKVNTAKFNTAKTEAEYMEALEELHFSQHNRGQHDDRKFRKPGDKDVSFQGTQVKAYVARGTHATYYEPHQGNGYFMVNLLGIKLYDKADGKGRVFNSAAGLVNIDEQPWNRFAGRWGEISNDICNVAEWFSDASNDGPVGPYYKQPYYSKSDWYDEKTRTIIARR